MTTNSVAILFIKYFKSQVKIDQDDVKVSTKVTKLCPDRSSRHMGFVSTVTNKRFGCKSREYSPEQCGTGDWFPANKMVCGHEINAIDAKNVINMVSDVKLIKFQSQQDDKNKTSEINSRALNSSSFSTKTSDYNVKLASAIMELQLTILMLLIMCQLCVS